MHRIILEEITVRVHIGVTKTERKRRQRMSMSIELYPAVDPNGIDDNIESTVNYSSVRQDVIRIMNNSTHRLIETVARKTADHIKKNYQVKLVRVTVKKYPYRDTKAVSYILEI
jgi:dihydroneopterin aldolase